MAVERMKSLCCINCYAVVMTASRAVGRFPHLSGKRQITNYVAVIERTVQKSAPGGVRDTFLDAALDSKGKIKQSISVKGRDGFCCMLEILPRNNTLGWRRRW